MNGKDANARIDFLQELETNMSLHIMSFLDNPFDLVRASSVSRFWRQLVIENGLAKELCLKTFLGGSNFLATAVKQIDGNNLDNSLQTDHEVYATLLYAVQKSKVHFHFIERGVSASSNYYLIDKTHNNPILGTYWSSNGHSNADVPETLTYKIMSGLWALTGIYVRACPAEGSPNIFSPKYVRFIVGHLKSPRKSDWRRKSFADDEFDWTYHSPEFPVKQEHTAISITCPNYYCSPQTIQLFKLPQPVLCCNGYLKVELLGRVQRHQKDGLFYICVSHVRPEAHLLSPAYKLEPPLLVYNPDKLQQVLTDPFLNLRRHKKSKLIAPK